MAYNPAELRKVAGGPTGFKLWALVTADDAATVNSAGYIADAANRGMEVNDLVIHVETDTSAITFLTVNAISSGAADMTNGLAVGTTDSD